MISLKIGKERFNCMIDTGASVNILDKQTFDRVLPGQKLTPSSTKLFAYGKHYQLDVEGKITTEVRTDTSNMKTTFYVLNDFASGCIIGCDTAARMGLVKFCKINTIGKSDIYAEFPEVFSERTGTLKDFKFTIHCDPNVPPVAQPARRIPFHVRALVSDELQRLQKDGIIERCEGATPWVSAVVMVPKKKWGGATLHRLQTR